MEWGSFGKQDMATGPGFCKIIFCVFIWEIRFRLLGNHWTVKFYDSATWKQYFPSFLDFICLHYTLQANAGFNLTALNNLYVINTMLAILNLNSHESIVCK